MRFEVKAAFALGVLLPVLETARRGLATWRVDATTMLEDYAGGALLLAAALSATRAKPYAARLLLAAWAGVTAMMSISLVSQIEATLRGVDLEPLNACVLLFKLALWLTSVTALVRSFDQARDAAIPRAD